MSEGDRGPPFRLEYLSHEQPVQIVSLRQDSKKLLTLTYIATNGEKPNDHCNHFSKLSSIVSLNTIDCDCLQKLQSNIKIEYGGYPNRPKEAHKDGLPSSIDLVDIFTQGKEDWKASQGEDEDPKQHQSIYRNQRIRREALPRTYSPKPNKYGQVEKHINGWLQRIVQSLQPEPVLGMRSQHRLHTDLFGELGQSLK